MQVARHSLTSSKLPLYVGSRFGGFSWFTRQRAHGAAVTTENPDTHLSKSNRPGLELATAANRFVNAEQFPIPQTYISRAANKLLPPVTRALNRHDMTGDTGHDGGPAPANVGEIYWPRNEFVRPYQATGGGHENMFPRIDRAGGLELSTPPIRIAQLHRPGMTLNNGIAQMGSRQWFYHMFLSPPPIPARTRGTRSVSGITNSYRAASRERLPSVFVPRSTI